VLVLVLVDDEVEVDVELLVDVDVELLVDVDVELLVDVLRFVRREVWALIGGSLAPTFQETCNSNPIANTAAVTSSRLKWMYSLSWMASSCFPNTIMNHMRERQSAVRGRLRLFIDLHLHVCLT
jgi:hypothetical protein